MSRLGVKTKILDFGFKLTLLPGFFLAAGALGLAITIAVSEVAIVLAFSFGAKVISSLCDRFLSSGIVKGEEYGIFSALAWVVTSAAVSLFLFWPIAEVLPYLPKGLVWEPRIEYWIFYVTIGAGILYWQRGNNPI